MTGSRPKVGILGDPHPGLNSSDFLVQRCLFFFDCRKSEFPGNRRRCRQIHLPYATFHSHSTSHSTDDMCTLAQGIFVCENISLSTRHGSSFAARDTEHFLFHLSCVVVVFFSEPRPVVHVSNYPLRRSTAGWHFDGISLLHTLWAPHYKIYCGFFTKLISSLHSERVCFDPDLCDAILCFSCFDH